ncbi:MAG: flippase [Patescibacteria group bacterium]|jgi:O-antigen/teichoic acid export membrane protein|nr:flippase [Patescibacteria group bacterium]
MNKVTSIAKNTSYLTLALILQKIISFTYFTLLARFIGPEFLGKYYLAISLTTIFAIFIDLGFSNVLIREVAKLKDNAPKWLGSILALKIPLSVISILTLFIVVHIIGFDSLTKTLVYISAISMVLDSFTNTLFATSRGCHNLKYESIASIIFQLIVLIFGYSALLLGGGLVYAMSALALASVFNLIYSYLVVTRKLKIKVRLIWDRKFFNLVFNIAWPFAVFAIFQRLYTYLDSVLLSVLSTDTQVGLYQVAFKIIFALQFLPLAFTASVYPALSTYWKNNREQLLITFQRALNYLMIISLPIVVGIFILAGKVVLLFEQDYSAATWPLRISILALFFIFLNFPLGSLLNACDAQRRNTRNMIIVTISSIILNVILITKFQALGASITVLITNALMFVLGVIETRKIIGPYGKKTWPIFFKTLISSVIMGIVVYLLKDSVNIFILSIFGGAIYFISLFVFKGIKIDDVKSIIRSFSKQKKI